MFTTKKQNIIQYNIPLMVFVVSALWIILIGFFLWYELMIQEDEIINLSAIEGQAALQKDALYRRWSSMHGGVYVPITEHTPPNPHLSHVKERDIVTPSGKKLTLMNPAYIARQLHELEYKPYRTRGHATSLNPIRKENEPDEWEKAVLKGFEKGIKETAEISQIDGKDYLRYMEAFYIEKGCLKCHGKQGYKVGDLRGGISVSVPLEPFKKISDQIFVHILWSHLITIFVGLALIATGGMYLGRREEERLEMMKELTKNERKYRSLFSDAQEMIFIINPMGIIMEVNPSGYGTLEFKEGELEGQLIWQYVEPEKIELFKALIANVLGGKDVQASEVRFLTQSNDLVWGELNAVPMIEEKTIVAIRMIVRNITGRRRVEQNLRESQKRYKAFIENNLIGVARIEMTSPLSLDIPLEEQITQLFQNALIVELNPAFADIFDFPSDVRSGAIKITDIFDVTNPRLVRFLSTFISSGYTISEWESHRVETNGKDQIISLSGIGVIEDKKLVRIWGTCRDITSIKNAEKASKKLEIQLRQAQKMEAIGTLAGGIAHDFNNILTAIIGYSEIIRDDLKEEGLKLKCVNEVLNAGNRAKDLVRQILAFSRQSNQEKQPIQVHLIIKEALKLLRPSLPATIHIEQDIETGEDSIMANPTQVHQIMMNLCTNAYHSMREKGGTLSIVLKTMEVMKGDSRVSSLKLIPGRYAKLQIGDTGTGMGKATQARIFEPYFTTKKRGEGTGLGLAVVHGIIKNLKGDITVHSEENIGTRFNVYLPISESHTQENFSNNQTTVPKGKERILLVDDEDMVAEMEQLQLESLGYRVKRYNYPQQALDDFYDNPEEYDLLITDMTMPELTGAELSQKILKICPDFPIIICTGFSDILDEKKAKAIGIKAYINKPIVKRDLAEIIRKILDC